MSEKGWITVHRQIAEHWLWGGEPFTKGQAWVDLLIWASHKRRKVMIKGQPIQLATGQQARSELTLSKTWGWSRGKVRRFLKTLENESMIVQRTGQLTSIITICNYSVYQSGEERGGTPDGTPDGTSVGTTGGHQTVQEQQLNNLTKVKTLTSGKPEASGELPTIKTGGAEPINPKGDTAAGKGGHTHKTDVSSTKPAGEDKSAEKAIQEPSQTSAKKAKTSKYKYQPEHHQIAVWMSCPVKQRFPSQTINLEEWANAVRLLVETDGYSQEHIEATWRNIINDQRSGFCWADNCRTPMKLRAKKDGLSYFEIINNQISRGKPDGKANRPAGNSQQSSGRENLQQRIRRETAEWAERQGVGQG